MEVPLSKGKKSWIDDNFSHLKNKKWFLHSNGYAVTNFIKGNGKRTLMRLHHCIVGYPLNKKQVDHINGNKLDNRLTNLRIVTCRENNQSRHIKKTSTYIGVSWDKRLQKWRSAIKIKQKCIHLGYFWDERKAADAYSIALLNLPREGGR